MKEKKLSRLNGFVGVAMIIVAGIVALISLGLTTVNPAFILLTILFGAAAFFSLSGFTVIQPNQAKVYTLFGRYIGVIREAGFWFTVPFTLRRNISLRVVNFASDKLKVNDLEGNPIEIAAVVVFKVEDAAKATFEVEDYEDFVKIQSETSLRHIASQYPYDDFDQKYDLSLRQHSDEVAEILTNDLHKRLQTAGVNIIEARIMHLAYSSEIAAAMLQRQQAQAVLAARRTIVEGAVGMVKSAIDQLSAEGVVELDEEKKAQMVNNLMVALVAEKGTQPIVNAGSIY